MKILMKQTKWVNNKQLAEGEVITADGDMAKYLLQFGEEIKDPSEEIRISTPEYETKVIKPKGKKK